MWLSNLANCGSLLCDSSCSIFYTIRTRLTGWSLEHSRDCISGSRFIWEFIAARFERCRIFSDSKLSLRLALLRRLFWLGFFVTTWEPD